MNYQASISDFFKSPKWGMNCLLGAVSLLIPIVGPLVLSGWHVTVLWARRNDENLANAPPFDFDCFVKYLERGLWPFLVSMVSSLVLVPVMMVFMIGPILLSGAMEAGRRGHGEFPVAMAVCMAIYVVAICGFNLLMVPLNLRATITQDFARAFDFGFVRKFLSLVWVDLLMSLLFMMLLGVCLVIIAVITCYIGMFFVMPVFLFSWHHLQKQLYQLYLARGGEPVPLSPKLQDGPPPLPGI